MNAAVALAGGPRGAAADTLRHLIEDPNSRIRLVAAGAVLAAAPDDLPAGEVVRAALSDPALRLRRVALDAVSALGPHGVSFLDAVRGRADVEEDSAVRAAAGELAARLEGHQAPAGDQPEEPDGPTPVA
jgi:HEAT repeat protein